MNTNTPEITPASLRELRQAHDLTQADVAAVLGIRKDQVSKIENATRELSAAERTVLAWYFHGTIPERIARLGAAPDRTLDFDPAEWRIITIIARRNGKTPGQWIADRIRDYLAVIDRGTYADSTSSLKVAETSDDNRDTGGGESPVKSA